MAGKFETGLILIQSGMEKMFKKRVDFSNYLEDLIFFFYCISFISSIVSPLSIRYFFCFYAFFKVTCI